MKLVFASGNNHKLSELKGKLPLSIELQSMREIGFEGDIEEPGDTLQENAKIKADFIHNRFGVNVFADDSGLEIESLDGRPGVYSARYAGPNCSFDDNNYKVLSEMEGNANRKARFRTIIHLIWNKNNHVFEGSIQGEIATKTSGVQGFGYDPIFIPEGYDRTFAEMDIAEKNRISHRALAVEKLVDFLTRINK